MTKSNTKWHKVNYSIYSRQEDQDCVSPDPADTLTDRLNNFLRDGGPDYVLRLCPGAQYPIQAPITFTAPGQEISTSGYPIGDDRATLIVNGPVVNGTGHTVAIDGTCADCSGVKLRNIQINGERSGAPPNQGGGNIEMGGPNSDQLIEYVHSYDPRSWTCLHIQEGPLNCTNVTIQYNDLGPCGSDEFQQWADGISLSCRNSIVRHNMIQDATDGGIVVFGSPGSQIYNNTIWITDRTLLGGINLVDYDPFSGDYTGTVVRDNVIMGGFADEAPEAHQTMGEQSEDAIIKIGIGIGPRTWFGDRYQDHVCHSGSVINNSFSGAFSYAMAITSARDFTVENNTLFGNTSFIGARGPNCSSTDMVPTPAPFVLDLNNTRSLNIQSGFQFISDGDALTCVLPPEGGDFWPFGGGATPSDDSPDDDSSSESKGELGRILGMVLGIVLSILLIGAISWFVRRWAIARRRSRRF
ncbi:hypothetical protein AX16_001898 [Volvariella volvacea WC 439]|nr:hypothetical protein AX16_001898 [Volvariella volvacea WC 439]